MPYLGGQGEEMDKAKSETKYRELKPGELVIDNSIVTTVEGIDATIQYLQDLKKSMILPDCEDSCCCECTSE